MNIHEYQAKAIFREYGVECPKGKPARTVDEAVEAAEGARRGHLGRQGSDPRRWSRQGGGVKLAKSLDEVREHADEILGKSS